MNKRTTLLAKDFIFIKPIQTVYMVYYRTTDGSDYQWTDRAITRELGQDVVDAGALWSGGSCSSPLTAPTSSQTTAESYTAGLR